MLVINVPTVRLGSSVRCLGADQLRSHTRYCALDDESVLPSTTPGLGAASPPCADSSQIADYAAVSLAFSACLFT